VTSVALRASDGTLTTIDALGNNYGTLVAGINSAGAITGTYILADLSGHNGFLRTSQGAIITFDPSDSNFSAPSAISDGGAITGNYCNATFSSCRGFVWVPHP
jgi:hypothetical protein